MSSNSKYHLLISNSCSNGTIGTFFDSSHQDKYSILQKMVADASLNKGRGIIAAFGAAGFSGQYWLDDGYDDYFHYASSAIIDSAFNTYGLVYRGSIKVLTAGGNEDEMGQNGFRASFQFVGDPSTSIRYTNPTSETAPNSYLAVSSSSVTVYTGGAVGDVRISAYAPNTEYFSTTTKTGNTNHTFSTSVRPLFVAITKDDASKIPSVWTSGGTLTIDTGIIGKLKINGDLTIQSGKTLSIYPDAELTFRASNDDQAGGYNTSKAELIINGTLSANNATFKSSTGVSGTWQGIYFEDGCSSSSEMKGCTIEDGYYGVVIKEDITIDSCDIYDIDYTAIKVSNSAEPIITDSKIRAGTFGIYLYDGSGTILRNDFIGPFDDISSGTGIYALGSDYTDVDYCDFTFSSTTTQQTYNKNGTTLDLYCCNMDVPGTGKYYMKEVSSGDANIGYSYMGCPADEIDDNNFYGDVSYFQMSDNPIGTAGATWKKQVGDDYIYALERMNHKDYSSAFLLLKKLINSPSVENKAQCFNLAMQAAKKMNILFDQTSYIQEIQNENLELNEILKVWQVIISAKKGNFQQAKNIINGTKIDNEGKKNMFYNLAINYHAKGFIEEARLVFQQIKTNYPEEAQEVQLCLKDLVEYHPIQKHELSHDAFSAQNKFPLPFSAFPNPFNSVTTIVYNLKESGMVNLKVYDILGREVCNIINNWQEQGNQRTFWNGKNDLGHPVPSGLYFISLRTVHTKKTFKVLYIL